MYTAVQEALHSLGTSLGGNAVLKTVDLQLATTGSGPECHHALKRLFTGFGACESLFSIEASDWNDDHETGSLLPDMIPSLLKSRKAWKRACFDIHNGVSQEQATDIANTICSDSCKTKHLKIATDGETLHGWEHIVSAAISNHTIKGLCLHGELPALDSLIEGLLEDLSTKNQKLAVLEIMDEDVSPKENVLRTWVENLQKNYTITELHLPGLSSSAAYSDDGEVTMLVANPIETEHHSAVIRSVCNLNAVGRKYMVEANTIENGLTCLGNLARKTCDAKLEVQYRSKWENDRRNAALENEYLEDVFFHLKENATVFFGGDQATDATQKVSPQLGKTKTPPFLSNP
ncbi:MAG: hypothetical protein SGILL_007660 [Bacillariaceae sp.]